MLNARMVHRFIFIVFTPILILNALRAISGEVVYEQLTLSSVLFMYSLANLIQSDKGTEPPPVARFKNEGTL